MERGRGMASSNARSRSVGRKPQLETFYDRAENIPWKEIFRPPDAEISISPTRAEAARYRRKVRGARYDDLQAKERIVKGKVVLDDLLDESIDDDETDYRSALSDRTAIASLSAELDTAKADVARIREEARVSEYFLSSRRQEALTALAQAEDDRNALSEHAGLLESQLTIVQSQDRCELATYHLCHACAVSAKVAFAVAIQRWHTWTVLDKERKSSLNESKRGLLNIAEVTALLAAAEKERDSMRGSMRQQQQSHEQRTRELQAQFDEVSATMQDVEGSMGNAVVGMQDKLNRQQEDSQHRIHTLVKRAMGERMLSAFKRQAFRMVARVLRQWWQCAEQVQSLGMYRELEQQIASERVRAQSAHESLELGRVSESQKVQAQWMQQVEEERRKMGSQLAKAASKELELQQALQAERNSRDQERTLLTSRETSREASEIASVHNELSSLRGQLASLTQSLKIKEHENESLRAQLQSVEQLKDPRLTMLSSIQPGFDTGVHQMMAAAAQRSPSPVAGYPRGRTSSPRHRQGHQMSHFVSDARSRSISPPPGVHIMSSPPGFHKQHQLQHAADSLHEAYSTLQQASEAYAATAYQ